MSRALSNHAIRAFACALCICAFLVASAGCGVEVEPAYPDGYYEEYPPDAYITTAEPFYYEGHATYWYGGRWYYRDGARWNHYDHEPRGLYDHRMSAPARRYHYEAGGHASGHAMAHPAHGHR